MKVLCITSQGYYFQMSAVNIDLLIDKFERFLPVFDMVLPASCTTSAFLYATDLRSFQK